MYSSVLVHSSGHLHRTYSHSTQVHFYSTLLCDFLVKPVTPYIWKCRSHILLLCYHLVLCTIVRDNNLQHRPNCLFTLYDCSARYLFMDQITNVTSYLWPWQLKNMLPGNISCDSFRAPIGTF